MPLVEALLFLSVVLLLLLFTRNAQDRWNTARFPKSLPSWPLIGSLLSLRSDVPLHLQFLKLQKLYGSIFSLRMGSQYMVVINNYQYAKEVLLKKSKVFAGRPDMLTSNLLSRDGKDIAFGNYSSSWKFHRKLVHSAIYLNGDSTTSLEKIICQEVQSACSMFEHFVDSPVDIMPEVTRMVTNVICLLCFNCNYERGDPEFQKMLQYSQGIVDNVGRGALVDIFPWMQLFPNEGLKLLKKSIAVRDSILQKKYEDHKANYNSHSINDLLDILLKAKHNAENNNNSKYEERLTDDHLQMTVADIFGAGVETTATTLAWTIIYLLHYPEVQKKIHEEIDSQIGLNRTPQLSDRSNLHFLSATISEILRIQPVSPLLIPHVAMADSSIDEYTVPKGTHVIVNLWAIHHDKDEWRNPDNFDPGRFLDENGKHIYSPSLSYMPFGAGVRACLGEMLARMEIFLFLSWFLQRFRVSVPPGHPLPDLGGNAGIILQAEKFKVQLQLWNAWENRE
ncbi:steroid 17-alpha-hydroxylase/17,20 lyase [Chiloscyllium plagiosum]|uniref:steroid 17-alpha-hydroxylase/17,20 lyase n=1 Tax=Chiloscyllium plagiosum TaxID=36176 RepID=UPI001CB86667|nr:steroid 17-alpha-hydroxylase/17,20 lyase [Chiloscyllium plagiosum]